jgi:hypothetical protein
MPAPNEFQKGYRASLEDIRTILTAPTSSLKEMERNLIEFVETGLGIDPNAYSPDPAGDCTHCGRNGSANHPAGRCLPMFR